MVDLSAQASGVRDDGRRWWAVAGQSWWEPGFECAPTGRSAVAAERRAIVEAERYCGRSRRDAEDIARVEGIRVVGGPYTTQEAFELAVRWRLAVAVCQAHSGRVNPSGPVVSVEECRPWLDDERIARVVAGVARSFTT